jgi:hypothetical protein
MSAARAVSVDIGGKSYVITSDDNYLADIENGFEPDMVRLFRSVASGSDVILDVGANIGCTALLLPTSPGRSTHSSHRRRPSHFSNRTSSVRVSKISRR